MKSIIGASIMALLLVCLALPGLVLAGAEGSATGSFKFDLEDGETRFVEFSATQGAEGQATGEMTFSDPVAVPVDDPDAEDVKPGDPGVLVRAKFDCMSIVENRAVMSGEIFDSNVPSNIGQRVLLVIEDNGVEGVKDRVTWGVYKNPATGWTPQDAEDPDDKGASLTWIATDAEQPDDKGVPSNLSKMVACTSFPLASFEFPEIKGTSGDLVVK